jgi:MFS transporter, OFA family, oxalate/formate antiporter
MSARAAAYEPPAKHDTMTPITITPARGNGEAMSTNHFTKRWEIAIAGIIMQVLLGTVYGWSVFKLPLMKAHGWSGPQAGLAFTLAILFIGVSAAFGGRFVDRAGARKVATLAAVLFGAGTLLAGLADSLDSKVLFWLGYGVIAGTGNGLAYITPIAVLVRWFPDRRGLITGLAVMGFGFGGALMGQVAPLLIPHIGVANTFYLAGALFLIVLLAAAQKMVNPPDDWHAVVLQEKKVPVHASVASVDFKTACRMCQFYLLWLILFINVTAGIALISNLSPMAQAQMGLTAVSAGTLILIASLFNGLGRIFWASVSDRIGRRNVFLLLLGTQIPVFIFLPQVASLYLPRAASLILFGACCCYIYLCYGGGFSTMPSFAADTFGARNIGGVYGPILLAWGVAGVVGPMMMEFIKKTSNSFNPAFYIAACLLVVGFLLVVAYRKPSLECG